MRTEKSGPLSTTASADSCMFNFGNDAESSAIFAGAAAEPHSLNLYYDRAIAAGRLFGHVMQDGHWFTVGTPEALPAAETRLKELQSALAD